MTYKELINKLNELPVERLNDDVSVYVSETDEMYAASGHVADGNQDVLDDGHFYLIIP